MPVAQRLSSPDGLSGQEARLGRPSARWSHMPRIGAKCLQQRYSRNRRLDSRQSNDGVDRLPYPFRRRFDLTVPDMGVPHGRAHIAVPEQTGDKRKRHAVHRRLTGYGMAQVVQAGILNACLAPHRIPERKSMRLSARGILDGWEDPGTGTLRHAPFHDVPRLVIQHDCSWTSFAVAEFQPVNLNLVPAKTHDLVFPAAGQQQETNDVGLLRLRKSAVRISIENTVKPSDFLARKKPAELDLGIASDAASQIDLDMAAGERMIEDQTQEGQRTVRAPGRRLAVFLEPPNDLYARDAVETL